MALLLSVDTDIEEQRKIGWLLIGMDVTFLIASIFSIVISILMLRKRFKAIQNKNDKEIRNQSVTIVPIKEKGAEKKLTEEEEEENGGEDENYRFTPENNIDQNDKDKKEKNQDQAKPHCIRSLAFTSEQHLGNFGDNIEARQIHDNFHIHEEGLKRKTEQRQIKSRRHTQVRLKARTKLKDSKALSKIKSFSKLKEDEVNEIIESMDHIVRFKGDPICRQHDPSDSFYIIVKGTASVTVNVEKKEEEKIIDEGDKGEDEDVDEEETKPEQEEVATIETLGFFGEGALIAGEEIELCTATVTVSSEKCVLLRLKRLKFLKLMETNTTWTRKEENDEDGDNNKSIIEQMKETRRERSKSNRVLMNSRNDDGGDGGRGGDGDDELVDKNEKIEEEEKKTEVSKVMVVPLVKGKETKKSAVLRPAPAPPLGEPDILDVIESVESVSTDTTTSVDL